MPPTTPNLVVRAPFKETQKSAPRLDPQVALPVFDVAEYCLNFATAALVFSFVARLLQLTFPDLPHPSSRHEFALDVLLAAIVVMMMKMAGAYRASCGLLRVRETACVLRASTLSLLVIAPSALLLDKRIAVGLFALALPLLAFLLVVEKHLMHTVIDAYRKRGMCLKRVLIYGSGDVGKRLFATLSRSPRLGLLPVAMVDHNGAAEVSSLQEVANGTTDLRMGSRDIFSASMLRKHRADVVLITSAELSRRQMMNVISESSEAQASVVFAADLAADYNGPITFTELDGELLYGPADANPPLIRQQISRAIDILVSATALLITSPLLLFIALMIRLDSPGPVLFRQQRVGKDGDSFTMFKFRSMHTHQCGDRISPVSSSDSRITRVGRILRKTSLDELPQLINILLGDMALVGPRPEMQFIVAQYTPEQRKRLAVRPGLTGIWQISADRNRPIHENLHYDLYYLRNQSIYMDLAILFHTVLFAMKGV
jgi:exopolysaccharide biosynthesis polyprenyl glycosylphosphotransferase